MDTQEFKAKLVASIGGLERWVEDHGYRAYEPFDGLSSYLRPLTFHNLFLERLLQQVVRQSPWNLRPVLGVRPLESTKGRGYMAWGYLQRFRETGNAGYWEKAASCLDWLDENKAPGFSTHSWGNHFDFSSRTGKLPKHAPIIVWTSLIGQAFLDAYELKGMPRHLEVAKSVCRWILDLPRERTASGTCLSYVAFTTKSIHNSNMLGAAMLGRMSKIANDRDMAEVAREAMVYSCSRQLADGAWYYGEKEDTRWIDNFHTGYNLCALRSIARNAETTEFDPIIRRGFEFYRSHFFRDDGAPKYFHDRTYPIDTHAVAQSIITLLAFRDFDAINGDLAHIVCNWAMENMRDREGYFYYQVQPFYKNRISYMRWTQAWMLLALATRLDAGERPS